MGKKKSKPLQEMSVLHPNAAGIDVGSREHYVAVPADRVKESVRSFSSFTADLHALANWLKSCQIDTIAMESTGVYWIQLYLVLEQYGFEVLLVNASHIKNVAGRKSDVSDCQWIQQLHTFGLLRASFQPDSLTREIRAYMRHRKNLTQSYATHVLRIQKAFEQMNIKLHNVLTDITGKSGSRIIESILAGERNAQVLASLTDKKVKANKEDIIKSLEGNWRDEHLFELRQGWELYLFHKKKIEECDAEIEKALNKYEVDPQKAQSKGKTSPRRVYTKNRLNFNATEYLKAILGVDVTQIFGISELCAMEIIGETGLDMRKWPSKKHFASWLNLVPNNRTSGIRPLKRKKQKKKNRAGQAFMMAAFALQRSDHWLGEFYRRMKSKHGPLVATKATARKIAMIFYDMVSQKIEFNPLPLETYNEYLRKRKMKYIENQANKLGLQLVAG